FTSKMQDKLLQLLIAISREQGDEVCDILLDISKTGEDVNIETFRKTINTLVLDSQVTKAKDLQTGRLLIQMNRIAAENGIHIAVELNILGKVLLNLDQIVAVLAPEYNLRDAIQRHVQKMMQSKMYQELKPENLFSVLIETKKLTEKLPERLNKISENLANNDFKIKLEGIDEKRFTEGFQKVANRITLGLIIAAMIIGAAMLMQVPTTFTIFGYPGLAIVLFIVAAIAGIALSYNIIIKDEDFKRKK
ncbi:MAG: AarF/ABC1/UbiB kinase family protein, partial [Flavobacteriaceae bacterium]